MPRQKEFCEEQALEKAIELFWQKGYEATSMDELVKYMGVNRASLYKTYGNKHDLFLRCLHRYSDMMEKILREKLAATEKNRAALRGFFQKMVEESGAGSLECPGCFFVNTAVSHLAQESEISQVLRAKLDVFKNLFHDFLASIPGSSSTQNTPQNLDCEATGLLGCLLSLMVLGRVPDLSPDLLKNIIYQSTSHT